MRVRHGTRVRAAVNTAARGVAGPGKGSAERGEPGGAGRGGLWGARARPLAAGRGGARTGLTARPSPREARAPVARACAAAGLGNALSRPRALSQSPPPTSSSTSSSAAATAHLLPPPQPPSPPLSSSVLAFCQLPGKRRSSETQSPSAPVRHPPAAPRPRDEFRALGISQARRRGPLCALGAGELGRNACKRCTHAGECMYL